jgi:DNA repair photolyase
MKRFTGHTEDDWGYFLDIKENAACILKKELKNKKIQGTVLLGSVTDAYQPAEKKYEITRACLEILAEHDVSISILTKSNLVTRDIDLLSRFSNCEVGLTVEFSDDQFSSIFDPAASSISERIKTLEQLRANGIHTYAFMGPIMPGLTNIEQIIRLISGKVDYLMAESLNMRCGNKQEILGVIKWNFPELLESYQNGFSSDYWKMVKRSTEVLCANYGIPLKGFYDH